MYHGNVLIKPIFLLPSNMLIILNVMFVRLIPKLETLLSFNQFQTQRISFRFNQKAKVVVTLTCVIIINTTVNQIQIIKNKNFFSHDQSKS